mmetsp:Transcript_102866/g.162406  ORF Transcript_102866/g.162406 Transcript_102866/m.162406 type:complete len:206 (+) Transcript_102866:39-656(+)
MEQKIFANSGHPWNDLKAWEKYLKQEKEYLDSRFALIRSLEPRNPEIGEPVEVKNMRRRPHLNGTVGEIVGPVDSEGFCIVRLPAVQGATSLENAESRKMKVRPNCLQSLRKTDSAPTLFAGPHVAVSQADGKESMYTCSASAASRSTRLSGRSQRSYGSSRSYSEASSFGRSRASSSTELSTSWLMQNANRTKRVKPDPSWVII